MIFINLKQIAYVVATNFLDEAYLKLGLFTFGCSPGGEPTYQTSSRKITHAIHAAFDFESIVSLVYRRHSFDDSFQAVHRICGLSSWEEIWISQ